MLGVCGFLLHARLSFRIEKKEVWYTDCIFKTKTLASDIFTYIDESHEHVHVIFNPKIYNQK